MSQEKELKRIADSLSQIAKVYADPQAYARELASSVQQLLSGANIALPAPAPIRAVEGGGTVAPSPAIAAVEVRLSSEEREEITKKAMADIEDQMTEFKGFIAQALSELPEPSLKRIGDLIAKGEKFQLRRRHGCIYLDFGHGDDDFYLRI